MVQPSLAEVSIGKEKKGLRQLELLTVGVIFLFSCILAWAFVSSNIVKHFHFYQDTFAPAIMDACGHGFVQPRPESPSMTAFLAVETQTFSCADIAPNIGVQQPSFFQMGHRNLMGAVSLSWKLFGTSWAALFPLYSLLFGISAAACYVFFRASMSRKLAFFLTIFFIFSPPQLFNLPHLRDYAKAPFFLVAIAWAAWLINGRNDLSPHRIYLTSLGMGLFLGIGIGFRIDLLLAIPLLLLVLLIGQPQSFLAQWRRHSLSSVIFLGGFFAAAFPILVNLGGGGNMAHFATLGLMAEFDSKLGLSANSYSLGTHYLDMYANSVINGFANATGYQGDAITYPTRIYDQEGTRYLIQAMLTFPADMAERFFSAIWKILHLPIVAPITFEDVYSFYDSYRRPWIVRLLQAPIWSFLVVIFVALALFSIARKGTRQTVLIVFSLLYLCSYPALQFGVRHYFYLEVIGLWMIGVGIGAIRYLNKSYSESATTRKYGWPSFIVDTIFTSANKPVLYVGIAILAFVGLQAGLQHWQTGHWNALVERELNKPEQLLPLSLVSSKEAGWVLARLSTAADVEPSAKLHAVRIIARFDSRKCGKESVHLRERYITDLPTYDFTETHSLGLTPNTQVIYTAFNRPGTSYFAGFEMPKDEISCLLDVRFLNVSNWVTPVPYNATVSK